MCVCVCSELDALGDDLLLDDDSSYLDEASSAPSIPQGLPGEQSTNRVLCRSSHFVLLIGEQSFLS